MPKQLTLASEADSAFATHHKTTRRDVFLAEMDKVVPWAELCAVIEPFYPKPGAKGGRRPVGLERMLRIHFLQQCYALSDPAVEEALYDSLAMRRFVGIDLGNEAAPDETTVCTFRHLSGKTWAGGRALRGGESSSAWTWPDPIPGHVGIPDRDAAPSRLAPGLSASELVEYLVFLTKNAPLNEEGTHTLVVSRDGFLAVATDLNQVTSLAGDNLVPERTLRAAAKTALVDGEKDARRSGSVL